METHANDFTPQEYMIPEQNFAFASLPFNSPSQANYPQINVNNSGLEDKLASQYSSLLLPESKEAVLSKIDQYAEAGKAYINALQFHNAQKIYELVVEVQPRNEKAMILLARCLQMSEEYHKAVFLMKHAIELSETVKNDPFVWFNIAYSFFKIENYTQAEQNFKHCLRVDQFFPLKNTVYLYLGIIKKYNLQYKIAIEYFMMSLQDQQNQTADNCSLVLINIGQCLECFQEYDEAASCYNKSLCLSPNNFIALKAISWLFFQNGKISESKDILMQALYISQDREIHYMQARCLEQLGKHKEAMRAIIQAIHHEPNNPDNFTILGIIFNKLNMHMESFQSFQRAYHLDTSKIENLFNMALIYEVAKKYPDALKLYSKLLLLDPQDCIVLQRKACIESSNYQNLTEFQMRYPAFKPSATLWIENQKQPKYNVLHDISTIFAQNHSNGFANGSASNNNINNHNNGNSFIDQTGKDINGLFDRAPKTSILSIGGGAPRKDTDEHNRSSNFHKTSTFLPGSHKSSLVGNFQIKNEFTPSSPFQDTGYDRSRNNSFNLKVTPNNIDDPELMKATGSNQDSSSGRKYKNDQSQLGNQPLENTLGSSHHHMGSSNMKGYSSRLAGKQNQQLSLFSGDNQGHHYDDNEPVMLQQSHALEKKEEGEDTSFSNSPKKGGLKLRKESDLFYEQTRKSSLISNYGGSNFHNNHHANNGSHANNYSQFSYSPFNGPIAKDSIDFGYGFNNNYFGDHLEQTNPSTPHTQPKKSSFLAATHNPFAVNTNKNGSKLSDNILF